MLNSADAGSPEYWAETAPDSVAVCHGDDVLTYGEWNEQSNRVADSLAKLGLKAGDRIGMRFQLGFPWFILQRALQKLGVAQVTVNWKLTPPEANYILTDCEAVSLATDDLNPDLWLQQDVGTLITAGQQPGHQSVRLEDLISDGDNTQRYGATRAEVILYTSGTTGNPKGVPTPSTPESDAALDRLQRYYASVSSRPARPMKNRTVLLCIPLHHGGGQLSVSVALETGGTVVLLEKFDPEKSLMLIEKHNVNQWTSVPTMLQRIRSLPSNVLEKYDTSSLTTLICGAAPVGSDLKAWAKGFFGDDVLWETYGQSEAGMIGAISPQEQVVHPGASARAHVGVDIKIVDQEWNSLPTGTEGEIAVNSPVGITHYIGQPPLGEDSLRDGYLRTGDVGYLNEAGFLFITDRVKDMIVAGGVNIYPAEIEKVLTSHDGVESCAVIGIPQKDFGEQPLAFIVRRPHSAVDEDDLREYLEDRLAAYKRPRVYEFVEELPLNSTGKVMKNDLREKYWKDRERKI